MADKLTLVELHLHADNNEFESDLELNSDIGEVLRNRLGFGESDEGETLPLGGDESASSATADGGDTVQIGEDDETEAETETETGSAVVEIDPDTEVEDEPDYDEEAESGRGIGSTLLLLFVVGLLALAAWWYLGDDDIENEFEEL